MKRSLLAVAAFGLWITASEFIRNELIFKHYWEEQFNGLGLTFNTLPVNGILWMVWSFGLALLLLKLLPKFSLMESVLLAWLPAFVMMWIVCYNLQVMPLGLLPFAIPLSLFEVWLALQPPFSSGVVQ